MALTLTSSLNQNIELVAGTTFKHDFTVLDSAGSAVDLTGFTFDGEVRINLSGAIIANFTGTITSGSSGAVSVSMLPSETRNEYPGTYDYDWRLRNGSTEYTTHYGSFVVVGGVSQP